MSAMVSQITGVSVVQFVQAQIKEKSKLRVTGLCERNRPVTSGFPHKGPITRKMFPFDDVIMSFTLDWKSVWFGWLERPKSGRSHIYSVDCSGKRISHHSSVCCWQEEILGLTHVAIKACVKGVPIEGKFPTDTLRNNDAMITSSLRQNDVGDVVWT